MRSFSRGGGPGGGFTQVTAVKMVSATLKFGVTYRLSRFTLSRFPVDEYQWSSAAPHCGLADAHAEVDLSLRHGTWNAADWPDYPMDDGAGEGAGAIRRGTHTGRPLGTPDFVTSIERALLQRLTPESGGRPREGPAERSIALSIPLTKIEMPRCAKVP